MSFSKKFLIFTFIVIMLIPILTSCNLHNSVKLNYGLYIADWYGYSGITNDENAVVSLPFIAVGGEKYAFNSSYSSNQCEVTLDGKPLTESNLNLMTWKKDATYGDYTLYTLTITLPKLKEGIHKINRIKVPAESKEVYFPLHWIVEVKNIKDVSECLKVTGETNLSGSVLTGIDVELKNDCSSSIKVDEVLFVLDGYDIKPTIAFSPYELSNNSVFNTSNESTDIVIGSLQKRTIRINLNKEGLPKFISLQPFVICHDTNSNAKKVLEFYSPSIFSLFPQNEKDVENLLQTCFIKVEPQ